MRDGRTSPDPTIAITALVMPEPVLLPGLVESYLVREDGNPPSEGSYRIAEPLDSPDDHLAELFPNRFTHLPQAFDEVLGTLVQDVFERIGRALAEREARDLSIQTRVGPARANGAGERAVWVEFYLPELEAYALPSLPSNLVGEALVWGAEVDRDDVELFLDGPARFLLRSTGASEGYSAEPWISSFARHEAEEHFSRELRRLDLTGRSYLAAALGHDVFGFLRAKGWSTEALGEGEVMTVSTRTDMSREYLIRYPLLCEDPSEVFLECKASLRDHPFLGPQLAQVALRVLNVKGR